MLAALLVAQPALALCVKDNAIGAALGEFGSSIGNEPRGFYSSSGMRGFSYLTANNIRLEGLYFDRPVAFIDRPVEGNVIRVGLTLNVVQHGTRVVDTLNRVEVPAQTIPNFASGAA